MLCFFLGRDRVVVCPGFRWIQRNASAYPVSRDRTGNKKPGLKTGLAQISSADFVYPAFINLYEASKPQVNSWISICHEINANHFVYHLDCEMTAKTVIKSHFLAVDR